MTNPRRVVVVLAVPAVLALGGCAGDAAPGGPAEPAAIATWSARAGIAPELVYVTEVEGFELAAQSVGVMGDDGMSAMYVRHDDDALATVLLTTSRLPAPDVVPCDEVPDSAEPEPVLRCAVEAGGVHVLLDGENVEGAVLRAAAEAVRVPGADELSDLFADVPTERVPVERGDLPPVGDGAPMNEPGPGG